MIHWELKLMKRKNLKIIKFKMKNIKFIESELIQLRKKVNDHPLYSNLSTIEDVQIFMENHVYAVWDFMSLLKSLQRILTNINVPWTPKKNSTAARFINEIVWGEESDINELGEAKSHFEMYIDSMDQIYANTKQIKSFVNSIESGVSVTDAAKVVKLNPVIIDFIDFTFDVIESGKPHCLASAFTFGREDVIPDMFLEIINQSKTNPNDNRFSKLFYYLNRHIEIDGDEHGPISLKMVENLCGNDNIKWDEALEIAKLALSKRIALWDLINKSIMENKKRASINI